MSSFSPVTYLVLSVYVQVMATITGNIQRRKRRVCKKCKQQLSHSAYIRHQNPAVCPETRNPNSHMEGCITGPLVRDDQGQLQSMECEGGLESSGVECEGILSGECNDAGVLDSGEVSSSTSSDSEPASGGDDNMSDVEVFSDGSVPEEETSIANLENTSSRAKTASSSCESTKEDVQIVGHLNDTPVITHNLHIISLHICLFLSFFSCVIRFQNVVFLFYWHSLEPFCSG